MNWPIIFDTEQNYLPFRDISFMKDQEKLSNYLTDLDWSLRNRCHFLNSDYFPYAQTPFFVFKLISEVTVNVCIQFHYSLSLLDMY